MEKPTNETKKQGWSKTKVRRITFIVLTFVFVGAATGCFVVALQEVVKEEDEKLDKKNEHGGENGQG